MGWWLTKQQATCRLLSKGKSAVTLVRLLNGRALHGSQYEAISYAWLPHKFKTMKGTELYGK